MQDSAFLDHLMADAWPPTVSEIVGRSRLRWASGFTRRANSCLAVGDDDEIPEIVARATEFYSMRHAEPVFMVSTASAPPLMASHLRSLGFESTARTLLQTASSAAVAASCDGANAFVVESATEMTDAWFETYWAVEATRDRDDAARTICRDILGRTMGACYGSLLAAGQTVSVGQIVVEQQWAGVQCMATLPSHRRRGGAAVALGHLADRALEMGAANMYLAVMHDNHGARSLYERSGFSTVHEYSYYSPTGPEIAPR
jgi:N-acetylglutamate synthase